MKINSVQNYSNPTFGIKISPKLYSSAHNLYCDRNYNQGQFDRFYRKAKIMEKEYGFDNYTIVPKEVWEDGVKKIGIFAIKGDNYLEIVDNYTIAVKKILEKGKDKNVFSAAKGNEVIENLQNLENIVCLTVKDNMRKALTKFIYMDGYELSVKILQQKNINKDSLIK